MIYKVRHIAKLEYIAYVQADSEDKAKSADSYVLSCENNEPVEHYWYDSEIWRVWDDDDKDAPEPDFSLQEAT